MIIGHILLTWLQLSFLAVQGHIATPEHSQDVPKCSYDVTLHSADCSQRNLSAVPQNLPTDIQYLNMQGNVLTNIPAKAFINYPNLVHLTLECNMLHLLDNVFDPDAFLGLDKLKVIKIGYNCDSSVNSSEHYVYPDKAFSKLTSLVTLVIDGVPKAIFGKGFQNLKNIQNITFEGYCYLNYIHRDMFNKTLNLRFLNMSNCHIYDVHRDAFSVLAFIDVIDISNNYGLGMENLTSLTYGLQGSSIRRLYANSIVLPFSVSVILKNNSLDYLHETNIREIYLDHNRIEMLEPGIFNKYPPNLRVISVNDNQFTMGQYVYDGMKMTSLEHLYVSDMTISHHILHSRQLTSLSEDVENVVWQGPPNLQRIVARNYLMGGKITEMNINMSRITSVDFSYNVLTEWRGPVKFFKSLQSADLSRCFCSQISPDFFAHFPKLAFLNISYNLIGDALKDDSEGAIFQKLTSLQTLDLSTNRIRSVHPAIFLTNTKLRYLDLSGNEIANVSFEIKQLVNLIDLDLRRNGLRTLPGDVRVALDSIPSNLSVDLSENPIQCTCENVDFLIWLSKTKVIKSLKSYECIYINNENTPLNLTLISDLEIKCKSFFGIITGGLAGIVLFLTVSVMGLVYRYRWKLKYLYYVARDRYRPLRRYGDVEERYYEFDVFISCCDEDMEFANQLLRHLEGQGRRLCVHHRDFKPGEPIAANIVRAVQRSRRTLIVLSRHFLSSTWCRYEYEMAKMESVHEGRNVILVVKIGEIDSADIPRELMYMMKTDSYADFPDRVEDQQAFWVTLNSAI